MMSVLAPQHPPSQGQQLTLTYAGDPIAVQRSVDIDILSKLKVSGIETEPEESWNLF